MTRFETIFFAGESGGDAGSRGDAWNQEPAPANFNSGDRMDLLSRDELRCLDEWLAADDRWA